MSVENTRYGAERIGAMLEGKKNIFFIGIGGISMSSLAHISHVHGYNVGGSDRSESSLTKKLSEEGIKISYTHSKDNVAGYDMVVYTVAISEDNPEYLAAKQMSIPTVSRADYLGYVMKKYKNRIGVSGAHGKSTCTSMIAHTFMNCDKDPTVVSGAVLDEMGGAYRLGDEGHFVFEACEYMDNFLSFYPTVSVILNVEYDHSDYFKDIEQTYSSFASFADLAADEGGVCVYNADDKKSCVAFSRSAADGISFGIDCECDYRAVNIKYEGGRASFDILHETKIVANISLTVIGRHNIYNALACFAVCDICGVERESAANGIGSFGGCKRRMEYKGEVCGAPLYEDYAHHPTEILASISAAADFSKRKVLTVFQPHTYSRTAELYSDFVSALSSSDEVVLADIYSARETDTLGVSSEGMAHDIGDKARYIDSFEGIRDYILSRDLSGYVVLIMGAGDISKVSGMLIK